MNNLKFLANSLVTTIALGTILSLLPQQDLKAATFKLKANLDGSQEVPPVATLGNGFATGTLTGDFGSNNFVFTYEITYSDLSSPIAPIGETGGHLHNAPIGSNGPINHILDTVPFNYIGTTSGTIIGDWRFDDSTNPLTEDLAQELIDGNIYINIHTDNFNSGEIRGQLTTVPESSAFLGLGLVMGLGYFSRKTKVRN